MLCIEDVDKSLMILEGSFSTKLGNKGPTGDLWLLTLWRTTLSWIDSTLYLLLLLLSTLARILRCPPAFFLCYSTSVVRRRYCKFFTGLEVWIYKFAFPQGVMTGFLVENFSSLFFPSFVSGFVYFPTTSWLFLPLDLSLAVLAIVAVSHEPAKGFCWPA